MRPTRKQAEIIVDTFVTDPRILILEGAVRSGKTVANVFLFNEHVKRFRNQNRRFIVTGTSIASIKRNVLDVFNEIPIFPNVDARLNIHNEFELHGNKIACFGASDTDDYKKMKGFTSFGWLANEITEHHPNSVDQAFKRCSGEGARIFWDTNPAGPEHHIKQNYIDKSGERLADGTLHIKSWHFILDDNTFLDPQYVDSIKRSTPTGVWYDRDILGLWVAAEGMIYRDFNSDIHVIDSLPQIKEYFAGIDWGFEHNGVLALYGIDHDGNAFRIKEIVQNQQTIQYWIKIAKEIKNEFGNIVFYCDPARPDYIADLRNNGLIAMEAHNQVVEGITFVAELFRTNRLFINRLTNKNYLKEIYSYRWKEHAFREEPIKEIDDSMDSERYALYSHIGKSNVIKAGLNIYR